MSATPPPPRISFSRSGRGPRYLGGLVGALVDEDLVGLICLDSRGRIVEANERGRKVLHEEGGLRVSTGNGDRDRLSAHLPEDAEAVDRLLEAALSRDGTGGPGASTVLGGSPDRPALALHCRPVAGRPSAPFDVAAVLAIVPTRLPVRAAAVREALDLTPAESRVAAALARGETVVEIARAGNVQRNTIHWHLKECYGKTNCRTQAELVSLVVSVLRLPMPAQADQPDG